MPLYDFQCSTCEHVFDEFLRLEDLESKNVLCPRCSGIADRLISLPNTHKDLAYSFVDVNTTGRPVHITSKGHWKRHLRQHGLTDDFKQGGLKHSDLVGNRNKKSVEENRREIRKTVESALRDEGKIR